MERWILFGGALALGGLAAGTFAVQRRAKTCSVHSHRAGQAAVALGVLCALASLALIAVAILLPV